MVTVICCIFAPCLEQVEDYNATRLRMNAEMADSSNLVKLLLMKAEDVRILGDMGAMRQSYRRLFDLNRWAVCGVFGTSEWFTICHKYNGVMLRLRNGVPSRLKDIMSIPQNKDVLARILNGVLLRLLNDVLSILLKNVLSRPLKDVLLRLQNGQTG